MPDQATFALSTTARRRLSSAWPARGRQQPRRIVSDEEAEDIEGAEALAKLRKQLEPRANASAYRPYSGGLLTLGKRR